MERTTTVVLVKKGGAFILSGPVGGDLAVTPILNMPELARLTDPANVDKKIETKKLVFITLKSDV